MVVPPIKRLRNCFSQANSVMINFLAFPLFKHIYVTTFLPYTYTL